MTHENRIESLVEAFSKVLIFFSFFFVALIITIIIVRFVLIFCQTKPTQSCSDDVKQASERYWHDFREREIRFERFTPWSECPRCLTLDLHPIKDTLPHSCRRQCSKCKYVWRQI